LDFFFEIPQHFLFLIVTYLWIIRWTNWGYFSRTTVTQHLIIHMLVQEQSGRRTWALFKMNW